MEGVNKEMKSDKMYFLINHLFQENICVIEKNGF
jgi:hypothetical protein